MNEQQIVKQSMEPVKILAKSASRCATRGPLVGIEELVTILRVEMGSM